MGDPAPLPNLTAPYVFVSYASADRDRVMLVVEALRRMGVPVWLDQRSIAGGENYALEIADAIAGCAALLLLCSAASLASRNVKQEIALAWKYARPYLPLLLEPVAIPRDIEYWLEAAQWIEVLDKPEADWLPQVLAALEPLGITAAIDGDAPPLAGREREQEILRQHLATARAGNGSLTLIGGEAGIGKTTLAEAVLHEAARQGCIVLEGHCFDLAETPPYGPWIDLFAHLPTATTLPPLPAAFAERGTVGAVTSQMALFVAVEDFLRALTTQRPAVLLLDDLHWSDPASLDLLRFLARSLASLPLLILVTYRSDELTRRHPLFALLPQLARDAAAERLDLSRLDDAAVHALVAARYALADADASRLVAYLQARAEGNALFVGELLRSLEETGTLRREETGWVVGALDGSAMPPLLRQVIETRLSRLDDESQRLLTVGAVIGHEVPLAVWASVAETDEETVLAVVEQGLEVRLLVEVGSDERVRFAHALIREALYEGIPGIRRRRMHRQVGESLVASSHPDPDAVAYHFQQARDARAVEWLNRAGERALQATADPTAIDRFEAALTLMDLAHEGESAERAWLLTRLASAHRFTHPQQSIAHLEAAATIAARLGDRAMMAFITKMLGGVHFFTGELAQSIAEMRAGMTALEALSAEERERLGGMLGTNSSNMHNGFILYLAAAGYLHEVVKRGERAEPHDLVTGSWHLGLWLVHAHLGQPEQAEEAFQRACAIYRSAHDFRQLGGNYHGNLELVILSYHTDDLSARRRCAEQAEAAWQQASVVFPDYKPQMAWLPLLLVEGRWNELAELIPSLRTPNATLLDVVTQVAGPFARLRGDAADAWRHVRVMLPQGPATEPGSARLLTAQCMQRLAVALALDAGEHKTAKEWLDAHDRWLEWSGAVLGQSEGQALWAQYHRQAGDMDKAWEHTNRALAHASEPRQPLALLAAHRLLGELGTDAGQFDSAAQHLDESLALATACQAPYERALTLLAMAELRAVTGDNDTARALIADVKALCEPLGAKPTLARAETLAQRLDAG